MHNDAFQLHDDIPCSISIIYFTNPVSNSYALFNDTLHSCFPFRIFLCPSPAQSFARVYRNYVAQLKFVTNYSAPGRDIFLCKNYVV